MNQELKDALAELTRQADKLEEFDCTGLAIQRCGRTPSADAFLRARQYRLVVKTIQNIYTATNDPS